MIKVTNLSFQYPNGIKVLNGIDFRIAKGEFVALIGQNGAGKTTLLKQFNALLKPTSGSVQVAGIDTRESSTSVLAGKVGFLFQNPDHQIFMPDVRREIGFGPRNLGLSKPEMQKRVAAAAAAVGLTPYLAANPLLLSKGQRQRVAFASVLAMQPEILVLDEPTTGQDYREGIEIMEMVRELNRNGHTIIFVTHDMELVAGYAKRVVVLSQGGVLLDDTTRNVFYQPEVLLRTHLFPPQIAQLVQRLAKHRPLTQKALTVPEAFGEISLLEEVRSHVGNC